MSIKFGIDVSQLKLDLASATNQNKARFLGSFDNHRDSFEELALVVESLVQEHEQRQIELVIEPTGGYEAPFARWVHERGWKVSMPNPRQVRDWAKGKGQRAKTDKVDAKMLARYGWGNQPPQWHPMEKKWAELDQLLQIQQECKKQIRRVSNQIHALEAQELTKGYAYKSHQRSKKHYEKELERVKKAIEKKVQKDIELSEKKDLLLGCPGVGEASVLRLMVFLAKWWNLTEGKGSTKGITAMAGLDPRPQCSGTSIRKRSAISKQGDVKIRTLLFTCAGGGSTAKSGPLVDFYKRMRTQKGHGYKAAVVACSRKLLSWSWGVFRDHKPFDMSLASTRENRKEKNI